MVTALSRGRLLWLCLRRLRQIVAEGMALPQNSLEVQDRVRQVA